MYQKHWDNVYETKAPNEVSWTQLVPKTSLDFIRALGLEKSAKIIDVGGGESNLVDFLLDDGYENITVLDISSKALEKSQKRLGTKADKVNWIVSDITLFDPTCTFDIWHDRATFHFLTAEDQIAHYKKIVEKCVNQYLVMGTFSENGPEKCSGLEIQQYSEENLNRVFAPHFENIKSIKEDHVTPFNTVQNFLFSCFKRC